MERIWILGSTAVTVALVDFADPALGDGPGVRERGARLEVHPVRRTVPGSVYSSPETVLEPALVRVDLLESAPGAGDRMHWHPSMTDGEPGEREFDPSMVGDPAGWVGRFLHDVAADRRGEDRAAIEAVSEEIVAQVAEVLARARQPWPEVTHDERGLAVG